LLVIVTPELVRPIPQGAPLPQLKYPAPFMDPNTPADQMTPVKGYSAPVPQPSAIPIETLLKSLAKSASADQSAPLAPLVTPAAAPKR
ncbi:MAG: hypothetical protein ACRD4E_09080, partial [Bryobacteraceae bacterium]